MTTKDSIATFDSFSRYNDPNSPKYRWIKSCCERLKLGDQHYQVVDYWRGE